MKITVPESVLMQEVEGEFVILDQERGRYLGLDAVASSMWRHLLATQSVDGAIETLLTEYEVDETRLRGDLDELIARLVAEQLVIVEL